METNFSIEVFRETDEPMYIQLYKIFKDMVEKGAFKKNEKLPPIRKMSKQLGVNSSTVVNAYRLLEKNGYVYSVVGSGTYVSDKKTENAGTSISNSGFIGELGELRVRSDSINFANSSSDPELFPVDDFKWIFNEILDRDGGQAFSYTETKGYKPLRECIAEYMTENGLECDSEKIQIISGAQQGIDIIAKVLIDYGDIIITEKPTYPGAIGVFKSRGAQIVGVKIENGGMNMADLENKLKEIKPKFIYIMTNFQNPTGFSYSQHAKEKLLYFARKYDFYIIEDDYLSELYYSSSKPTLLKSMDYDDRVIFIKSFSKIFMPGMRLGFLIAPVKVQNRIAAAKQLSDISTSGFIQRAFDIFIRKKMLTPHVNNIREKYKKRYLSVIKYSEDKFKDISCYKPEGGIHLWYKLPGQISSNVFYTQCLLHNVIVSPGSAFYVDEGDFQYFRLSYASTDIDHINKGMKVIREVYNELKESNKKYENIPIL